MSRKFTYEEVKECIEDLGYILISKKYIDIKQKLILCDYEGYYYSIVFDGLKHGNIPEKFYKSNPYTIYNIKLWCKLHNKSFELLENQEYKGNNIKLKWKCLKEECDEIFQSSWNDILNGHGCSFCSGKQVGLSNCLATKNPELAKEWHPTKNRNLTPYNVTCNNSNKVWWQCEKDHEWEALIYSRNSGKNCPYCSGRYPTKENNLLVCNPELASAWNYNKNDKKPEEYTPRSAKSVWWICDKCGHEWESTIANRNNNIGCPCCAGKQVSLCNCLATIYPELASQWHPTLNGDLTPYDVTSSANKDIWWQCDKGHEWQVNLNSRTGKINHSRCPYCSGLLPTKENNLLIINPELCKEWDYNKNKKKPEEYLPRSNKKVWWICKECGFEWYSSINNRYKCGCPHCNKSKGEKEVSKILNIYDINNIFHHTFSDCKYKQVLEFDFYLLNYIVAIEYQGEQHYFPVDFAGKGLEWAKEQFKINQIKDQIKRDYCKNNNIKLIEIPYWDFDNIEQILIRELVI